MYNFAVKCIYIHTYYEILYSNYPILLTFWTQWVFFHSVCTQCKRSVCKMSWLPYCGFWNTGARSSSFSEETLPVSWRSQWRLWVLLKITWWQALDKTLKSAHLITPNSLTVIWTGRTMSDFGGQGNKNTELILLNHRFQRAFSFASFIQVCCFHMNQLISMS